MENTIGGRVPDAIGHTVTNVLSNANPVSKCLSRVFWKLGGVEMVIDGFIPGELKERTDISNITGSDEVRLSMVESGI